MHQTWVEGNRPSFQATFLDTETDLPINLASHTVRFRFWYGTGSPTVQIASVIDFSGGVAIYTLNSDEALVAGTFYWEWEVVDPSNRVYTQVRDPFHKRVRKKLGAA